MFTGIIEELGIVKAVSRGTRSIQLHIAADKVLQDTMTGDSIAVDGVCLTVTHFDRNHFVADVMPETMSKTTLQRLKPGSRVNLERALSWHDRLGGHLVQGHVDAVGGIIRKERVDIAVIFSIEAPDSLLRYIVPKGSVAIDGISLTVVELLPQGFTVSLIPHTLRSTVLGFKEAGDLVNLESDIIGRYVERLLFAAAGTKPETAQGLSIDFLSENGFLFG